MMSLAMNTYAGLPQHQATSLQLARRASVDLVVRPISDKGLDRLVADLLSDSTGVWQAANGIAMLRMM